MRRVLLDSNLRRIQRALIPLFGAVLFLCARPAFAQTNAFLNTSGDGLWGTGANWSLGTVPAGAQTAVVNQNRVATIATAAPAVVTVAVGNTAHPLTRLIVLADLSTTSFRVANGGTGSVGNVEQHAGSLSASSVFQVAATSAGVDKGTYLIDGGSLSAGAMTVGTQGNGFFTIEGTGATSISAASVALGSTATLKFTLGTLGVTRLAVSGNCTVNAGSTLIVDGTLYEGLDGLFPLIEGATMTGTFSPGNWREQDESRASQVVVMNLPRMLVLLGWWRHVSRGACWRPARLG